MRAAFYLSRRSAKAVELEAVTPIMTNWNFPTLLGTTVHAAAAVVYLRVSSRCNATRCNVNPALSSLKMLIRGIRFLRN